MTKAVNPYRLLDGIRSLQPSERQRGCRRRRIEPEVQLVQREDGSKGFTGVCRCGSMACPVCAIPLYQRRADEITQAAELWRLSGGQVLMGTFTTKHALGNSIAAVRKGVTEAWRKMRAGRAGQRLWNRLGVVHTVRAIEVTYGDNGWHVHIHCLFFVRGWSWLNAKAELDDAWRSAVCSTLGLAHMPSLSHGCRLDVSSSASYVAKLGLEVASITTKQGRKESRTPWQIAQDAAAGDEASRILWRDYSRAFLGAQRLTWSAHARRELGLERTRDELATMAQEDRSGVVTVLATWSDKGWDSGCRQSRNWTSRILAGEVQLPTEIRRHGVTIPERSMAPPRPPKLTTPERREPMPSLAKAGERQEQLWEAEFYPERVWYRKQRALGRLAELFRDLKTSVPA